MNPDEATLADLAVFARFMVETRDVEPWADLCAALYDNGDLDREESLWLLTLYNTYDDLGSAWNVMRRWPTPQAWATADDRDDAATYSCAQERRNLRGGRVLQRHASYVALLDDRPQEEWMRAPLVGDTPGADFERLTAHLRQVWGVGRQSAFEWTEFVGKVLGMPVDAADAQLWESSGPRRALERLFGNPNPSREWLDAAAHNCRDYIAATGVDLPWVDFETIICDFNVMRDGRYYLGRHLAALAEEITTLPEADQPIVRAAFDSFVPEGWRDIVPGINPEKMPVYRDTGRLILTP